MAMAGLGDVEAARELLISTMAEWRKAGCNTLRGLFTQALATIEMRRGRYEEALSLASEAIALNREFHDFMYIPGAYEARASILCGRPKPDYAAAEADLQRGLEIARAQGAKTDADRLAGQLAMLRAKCGAAAD